MGKDTDYSLVRETDSGLYEHIRLSKTKSLSYTNIRQDSKEYTYEKTTGLEECDSNPNKPTTEVHIYDSESVVDMTGNVNREIVDAADVDVGTQDLDYARADDSGNYELIRSKDMCDTVRNPEGSGHYESIYIQPNCETRVKKFFSRFYISRASLLVTVIAVLVMLGVGLAIGWAWMGLDGLGWAWSNNAMGKYLSN